MAVDEKQAIGQVILSEESIIARLKEKGLRLTEPRKLIINIVANEEFSCCKEVYFLAHKKDPRIGIATVYRMINILEEVGAISKKNLQKTVCTGRCCDMKGGCTVVTDKSKQIILSEADIEEALKYIMEKNGYSNVEEIKAVLVNQAL
ncbi:MAG: transcriptional repressor [Clostridium sp.]|nr:transcriptional repressor [Clostridium sp.]MCM1171077.1 transcriptional repressor [Clostridium sp.]MCM1207858.1 transcriptional repressor [Ruminococcus sp.]